MREYEEADRHKTKDTSCLGNLKRISLFRESDVLSDNSNKNIPPAKYFLCGLFSLIITSTEVIIVNVCAGKTNNRGLSLNTGITGGAAVVEDIYYKPRKHRL